MSEIQSEHLYQDTPALIKLFPHPNHNYLSQNMTTSCVEFVTQVWQLESQSHRNIPSTSAQLHLHRWY